MKKHLNSFILIFLVFSMFLPIYSMAQTSGVLKLRFMTETGDMITSNQPIIKNFFLSSDGVLSAILDSSQGGLNFTFAADEPHIGIRNVDQSCTISNYVVSGVTVGNPFSFQIYSDTGATIYDVALPNGAIPGQGTSPRTFSWTTTTNDIGTWLAVFQATATKTSQIVVMIKVNPAETVTPPTAISPLAGTVNQATNFTASGATVSTSGHTVEYRFNWGDGSDWSSWGSSTQTHTYASNGSFIIQAQARCATDHVESTSYSITVTISTIPTYTLTVNVVTPAGGFVSPSSVSGITSGGTATFTVTTNTGYTASPSEGTLSGTTWTIPNVTSSHPVTITFSQIPSGEIRYFNVQTTESISAGETKTFSFTLSESGKNSLKLNLYGYSPTTSASYKWIFPDTTEFPLYFVQRGMYVPDTIVGSSSSGGFEIRAQNSSSPNVSYPSIPTGTHTLKITGIAASSIGVWVSLRP